jgi:hypothetical protein
MTDNDRSLYDEIQPHYNPQEWHFDVFLLLLLFQADFGELGVMD